MNSQQKAHLSNALTRAISELEHYVHIPTEIDLYFHGGTRIRMSQANPKQVGSLIHAKYEEYKKATTIRDFAIIYGDGWKDAVKYDFLKDYLILVED